MIEPQVIYNSHYGNGAPAMFNFTYHPKLKGKNCYIWFGPIVELGRVIEADGA